MINNYICRFINNHFLYCVLISFSINSPILSEQSLPEISVEQQVQEIPVNMEHKDDSTQKSNNEKNIQPQKRTAWQRIKKYMPSFLHHYIAEIDSIQRAILLGSSFIFPEKILQLHGTIQPDDILSSQQQEKLYSILNGIGIDPHKISIKAIDSSGKLPGLTIGNSMIALDSNYLSQLNDEEQQFLIGHEAIHIKNNDIAKMAIISLIIPIITHYGLNMYDEGIQKIIEKIQQHLKCEDTHIINKALNFIKKANNKISSFCLTKAFVSFYLFAKYSQYLEKNADIQAAIQLNCAQGGVQFFDKFDRVNRQLSHDLKIPSWLLRLLDPLHPPLPDRIAYLQDLVKK